MSRRHHGGSDRKKQRELERRLRTDREQRQARERRLHRQELRLREAVE